MLEPTSLTEEERSQIVQTIEMFEVITQTQPDDYQSLEILKDAYYVESFKNREDNLAKQNISIDDIPYVVQYNKRDLENVAPVNYPEYVLNNRRRRVQSFEVISSTGQNVFASLNAVSQVLLHKFSKQSDAPKTAPAPVAIPVEPASQPAEGAAV